MVCGQPESVEASHAGRALELSNCTRIKGKY